MLKETKKIICKLFGHRVNDVDVTIIKIKRSAPNKADFKNDYIECLRCGAKL